MSEQIGSIVEALCDEMVRAVGEATLDAVRAAFDGTAVTREQAVPTSQFSVDAERLLPTLERYARDHDLSRREAQILEAAVHGVPRKYITNVLGTGDSTIKTQVKRLLKKTGYGTVDDLVWAVRREISRNRPAGAADAG